MIEHDQSGDLTVPLARTVGSKAGLASDLFYHLPSRGDPHNGYVLSGSTTDISQLLAGNAQASIKPLGKGSSVQQAARTFLGEAVERYHLFTAEPEIQRATYRELAETHELVDPKWFCCHSESEAERATECGLPIDTFDETERRPWIEGVNLLTGERTYVPSGFLFAHERTDSDPNPIQFVSSNGAACHETMPKALLASIYEYLERHAFTETWFSGKTPTELRTEAFETESEYIEFNLLEYEADIDIDVPLLGCLSLRTERKSPYAVFCGGSGTTYRSAIEGMLAEASQMVKRLSQGSSGEVPDPTEITGLDSNVDYYFDPANAAPLESLLDGETRTLDLDAQFRTFENPQSELEFVLDELAAIDVTPIAFDVTLPEFEELGLTVTKVAIPELLSLSAPSFPPDAHPRLAGRIERTEPHPYP